MVTTRKHPSRYDVSLFGLMAKVIKTREPVRIYFNTTKEARRRRQLLYAARQALYENPSFSPALAEKATELTFELGEDENGLGYIEVTCQSISTQSSQTQSTAPSSQPIPNALRSSS